MDKKIIQKGRGTPKVYKSGRSRATGWQALEQRAMRLIIDAARLAGKTTDLHQERKARWLAAGLRDTLKTLPATEDPAPCTNESNVC
jgi:hypothetical protein